MDYSKQVFSSSTDGAPILVAATSIGSGTTIHTSITGILGFDEIYLYASNVDTVFHTLTLGWGGTTTGDLVLMAVVIEPNQPPIPIITGLLLQNALAVKASADVTNMISITGFVNRIS